MAGHTHPWLFWRRKVCSRYLHIDSQNLLTLSQMPLQTNLIIYQGKVATTDPSVKDQPRGLVDEAEVIIDGNLITGKGLGTVIDLSLAIVRKLFGLDRTRCLAGGLVYDYK